MIQFLNIFLLIILIQISNYTQDNKESLHYRGDKTKSGIAISISNRTPIARETVSILTDLSSRGFRVALTKSDIDIHSITSTNSPFNDDTKYILKIYVLNESVTENLISVDIILLKLENGKKIVGNISFPRSNIKILTSNLEKIFRKFMPIKKKDDPLIISINNNEFFFSNTNFAPIKKGDEIIIQYASARNKLTESYGFVTKISNDFIIAKDINLLAEVNDSILNVSPKRNRFSFSGGLLIPLFGESILIAYNNNNIWEASKRWPVGLQISAEYERFLPYRLTSTTAVGLNINGVMGTFIFTGVGYRLFYKSWEFTPYIRLGVMYSPLALAIKEGTVGQLQGAVLQFGFNGGISMTKRLTRNLFVGLDIGFQWYPFEYTPLSSDSQKIKPQWNQNGQLTDNLPITEFYPYINIKASWLF